MTDWIDAEKQARANGSTRVLTQSQHAQVNARYPGCTLEYCCDCAEPTGRAGMGDDSLYDTNGNGPFCQKCYDEEYAP